MDYRQAFHMQAFVDYMRFAVGQDGSIMDRFRQDTGCTFQPGRTPLDQMIDKASGAERAMAKQFITWCAGQYGTEYLPPDYMDRLFPPAPRATLGYTP